MTSHPLIASLFASDRRFFVPEMVQTSAMDCGPATLKSILEGFGISVSYGRLREACQTDVDGTSIDTMEEVAVQLGLKAEQIMVPSEHLFLSEAHVLPAIVVVNLPGGTTHFIVAWQQVGPFIQVMDPAIGRHWMTRQRFLNELYIHVQVVPAVAWRVWAGSEGFCAPLRQRLAFVSKGEGDAQQLLTTALEDKGWYTLAALDAATRMVEAFIAAGGTIRGTESLAVLERLFSRVCEEPPKRFRTVPPDYWAVEPVSSEDGKAMLSFRGAVLVRFRGRRRPPTEGEPTEAAEPAEEAEAEEAAIPKALSPELAAALEEAPSRPGLAILQYLREDGLLTPATLLTGLSLAAAGIFIQALLLRSILDLGHSLNLFEQRVGALVALFAFFIALFLLEFPIVSIVLRTGRRLENRMRMAFLTKIPRLGDRYFQSRLVSDMAQRAHELRQLRVLPNLAIDFLRLCFEIVLTAIGIIWLNPQGAPVTILATVVVIGLPILVQPLLSERDLRVRTHLGALSRFYLDSLLGLVPIRTHGAEPSMRREHESLLVKWSHASNDFYQVELAAKGVDALVGLIFAALIVFNYIASGGEVSGLLLLFYWTMNIPLLGRALISIAELYPVHRNRVLRLFEPLDAPEDAEGLEEPGEEPAPPEPPRETPTTSPSSDSPPATSPQPSGVGITMEHITVYAAGHPILTDINLTIQPGEHVAIIGPSGAGKSSLVGMLLGWYRPASGTVRVDGQPLSGAQVHTLRRETVWVDPAVQLWNRSLLENIRYGNTTSAIPLTDLPIEQANLFRVLERLPHGLQTTLGEGGGLVSGGEGQRVRLGRAMFRSGVRLVILDEPFRGLDRGQRRELLVRAREYWRDATLLFISHDVGESQTFDRTLVIEHGAIVEDAAPAVLAARPDSRYQALLRAEEAVRSGMWTSTTWRRLWLEGGQLREDS
jgi:ATP-binding cassette subfamily B protein